MIRNLKINTALLLFTIFVFRILFTNAGVLSCLEFSKYSPSKKNHFSNATKSKEAFEAPDTKTVTSYSVEICDEDSDDDLQLKTIPFVTIPTFYSLGASKTKQDIKSFCQSFCFSSSPRYLTFRVFRI